MLRTFTASTSIGIVTVIAYSYGNAYRRLVMLYGNNIQINSIEVG